MRLLRRAILAAALPLAAIASTGTAQTFNFDNLEHPAAVFTGFLPSNVGFACTGFDKCSSNIDASLFGGALEYTSGGVTVSATGYYRASPSDVYAQFTAMQDHDDGYNGPQYTTSAIGAGLGVYHELANTSDDNITLGEMLKLSFSSAITMDWVGIHAEGHNTTGWADDATFEYSTNGTTWITATMPKNTGKYTFGSPLVSQDFYFRYGGDHADQYYVSAIEVTASPEPATLGLMALGLTGLGIAARRRRN